MSETLADLQAEIAALQRELDTLTAEQTAIERLTGATHWAFVDGKAVFDPRYVDAVGCTPEALREAIHPTDVERVLENWQRFSTDPSQDWLEHIFQVRQPDGPSRWFLGTMQAIERDPDGHLVHGLGGQVEVTRSMNTLPTARGQLEVQTEQLRDANRRLEAQTEQLRQANAALEEFAYAASHDLQAPLRAIAHFANWIDEDLPPNCGKQVRGHVKGLLGRVDRMVRLHADLLAYARIAGQTPRVDEVRLARLVTSTWYYTEPPGGFVLDSRVPDVVVQVAEGSLRTVLRNLLRNAVVHHDREEGQVTVEAEVDAGWLTLRILDDGPGVDGEAAEQIFAAMFRSDAGRPGSGMGLAIARRHATQAGGLVRFVPTEGRGAIFEVRWPLH